MISSNESIYKLGFKTSIFKSQLKTNWDSFKRKLDNLNFTNSCFDLSNNVQ